MKIDNTSLAVKIADKTTSFIGSWRFIIIQLVIILIWVFLNAKSIISLDPFPFIFLNLTLSFQAAFTAPIIMMSQNRQSMQDRMIQNIDFKTDKKAESEISYIINELKEIKEKLK